MKPKFCKEDDFEIAPGESIPYIAFDLSPEQAKQLEGKVPEIYTIDGKKTFSIKDKKGNFAPDRVMMFITFRSQH